MIDLKTPDGRRAAAMIGVWLGCVVMTLFAAVAVYAVYGNARYSFWLGIAAHVQIFVGLASFSALYVKNRTIKAGKDGIEISDKADKE